MRQGKRRVIILVTLALAALGGVLYRQQDQPRRSASQALAKFASALANPNSSELLDTVFLPVAIQGRTPAEQREFLTKALADEVSDAGVLALKRGAEFGPLKSVFPKEAAAWCQQADLNIDHCVAFKLERHGLRGEVVLVQEGKTYRVVRCNNVKQMATESLRS